MEIAKLVRDGLLAVVGADAGVDGNALHDAMVSRIAEMPSGKIVAGRSVNIALDELSPVPHSVVLRQIFFGVGGLMSVGERANDHDLPNDQ